MEIKEERIFNKKKYHLLPQRKLITDRAIADGIAEKIRKKHHYGDDTEFKFAYAEVISERHNNQEYYLIYFHYDLEALSKNYEKHIQNFLKKMEKSRNRKIEKSIKN